MANYPLTSTIKTTEGTEEAVRDGRQIDATADGLSRVRKLFADRRDFTVVHQPMSATAVATLRTFYAANISGTFYFINPIDGVTYTVAFGSALKVKKLNGGVAYIVSVRLVQVA